MNKYQKKLLIAAQVSAIILMTLFVVAAETSAAERPREIAPPSVPDKIRVEDGFTVFLVGHATGTQNYVCRPVDNGFAFVLFTPQATLFNEHGKQLITHFSSPNPFELNTDSKTIGDRLIRVTWQDSDTSSVWAKLDASATSVTDPDFVLPGSIAWVRLIEVGTQNGPTGGDTLTPTKFIQRVNTRGGVAPSTGCASPSDVGNQAFVRYTADYFFYKKSGE